MKRTLVMLLGAMLLTAGSMAFGDCMGPYESHGTGEPPPWQGTCADEVLELVDEDPWPANGPTNGEENRNDESPGTHLRTRDPDEC